MLDEHFWKGLSDLIRDFCGFTHTQWPGLVQQRSVPWEVHCG